MQEQKEGEQARRGQHSLSDLSRTLLPAHEFIVIYFKISSALSKAKSKAVKFKIVEPRSKPRA
eukprot:765489-Hanusia_phi.AAC.10